MQLQEAQAEERAEARFVQALVQLVQLVHERCQCMSM